MNIPKVSIVIPIYNAEIYLEDTIRCIINQTLRDIEIICVNDGSTDSTLDILEKYKSLDNRISIINQVNGGAGMARNRGLSESRGKYIIFLDADDIFDNNMIEDMYSHSEKYSTDIVICRSRGYDEVMELDICEIVYSVRLDAIPNKQVFSGHENREKIFQMVGAWPWDKMYNREFIVRNNIRFPEKRKVSNDLPFVDLSLAVAERIAVLDEFLLTHRTRIKGSLENSKNSNWMCHIDSLKDLKEELLNRGIYDVFQKSFLHVTTEHIIWYLNSISDINTYVDYYNYLKNKAVRYFELEKNCVEFYENDEWIYDSFCRFMTMNPIEYRYKKYNDLVEEQTTLGNYLINCNSAITGYKEAIKTVENIRDAKIWRFPYEMFPNGGKVIIYGYGDVGKDFCKQLDYSNYVSLVAIADSNYEKYNGKIISPDNIIDYEFDYVLISILNKDICSSVFQKLLEIGVNSKKIIAYEPF